MTLAILKYFHSLEKYIGWLEEQLTDIGRNPNHKFMEHNLSVVIDRTLPLGAGVSAHVKVHYQFHTMFVQTHQEILHFKEIFQNVHLIFLDTLDPLQNHTALAYDTETTTSRASTSQDHSKWSVPSGLGEMVMSIFGGGSSGRYS